MYMVKVAFYLTAFYMVYSLMLSRDTYYARNRAYILFSMAASLIFPLISLQTLKPHDIQFFGKLLSEVFVRPVSDTNESLKGGFFFADPMQIVYTAYFIGAILFFLKLVADIFNLLLLITKQKTSGSRLIRFHGFNTAGFSAMGYIFINTRLNEEEAAEIIRHEQNHLRQNHFIDIIFVELVKAIQWFNPVIHMFNRSLRAIHEYQADLDCLNSGVPVVNYQSLLLSQVFRTRTYNLTNSFSNPSLIKKRMIMMTKKPTSSLANVKLLLVLPVTAIVFLAISAYKEIPGQSEQQAVERESPMMVVSQMASDPLSFPSSSSEIADLTQNRESLSGTIKLQSSHDNSSPSSTPPPPPPPPDEKPVVSKTEPEPFVVVEEMPTFPGGDSELLKYIGEHTIYPQGAKEQNIQGRVIVRFCITSNGEVSHASVLKGVSPELDQEALRVVNSLPAFEPGRQGGVAVPVWYMVPITFTLR